MDFSLCFAYIIARKKELLKNQLLWIHCYTKEPILFVFLPPHILWMRFLIIEKDPSDQYFNTFSFSDFLFWLLLCQKQNKTNTHTQT